jgi:hypothetical protein
MLPAPAQCLQQFAFEPLYPAGVVLTHCACASRFCRRDIAAVKCSGTGYAGDDPGGESDASCGNLAAGVCGQIPAERTDGFHVDPL